MDKGDAMGRECDRDEERLWELLADQAVFGLVPHEVQELASLLAQAREVCRESLEQIAASIALAGSPERLPALPASLRTRIRSTADRCFNQTSRSSTEGSETAVETRRRSDEG